MIKKDTETAAAEYRESIMQVLRDIDDYNVLDCFYTIALQAEYKKAGEWL